MYIILKKIKNGTYNNYTNIFCSKLLIFNSALGIWQHNAPLHNKNSPIIKNKFYCYNGRINIIHECKKMKSNIKIKTKRKRNNHSLKQLNSLSIFLSKIFKKNLYFQLKTKFSTEFFDWLYNKNPNGRAIINNIYENNKIVAHFALVPVKVLYKKKIYKSALSVFTAVDKNNRGLYYFHKIATKSLQIAKSKGIRFVIGVSNEASAKIFINVLNFKLISLDVK